MSNAVKHLSGIERLHLKARRDGEDYIVSGSLPWVSNVGKDHLVIVVAALEDEPDGYVMFAVRGDAQGVSLHDCPDFSGMEGTGTFNIRLADARIPAADVLAHPAQFDDYFSSIKPGFVLAQTGMGFGIIEASLKTIRESNIVTAHVNQFLDDQGEDLAADYAQLQESAKTLAAQAQAGQADMLEVLKLRAATSELTLRATNSAVLHAGAKGYLMRHPAQRRLREAVFVAIVTPALKHLRKEISALQRTRAPAEQAEAA
jgi:alkylation response protein AidB-like acyl-CoA dehydrogenase